ncbi:ribosomal protein S18 [Metabacillus crassostreae]|uniref:hypothetical protein n=1 Tax=Metabacillus crassostreae TaxID=929098 RepID=UPI00195C285E|nr:hypothetical protein [Metabacillus crassostreae]MBM7605586.1 ribosomal protein S18 [Metabacillus crassostreae]
MKKLSVYLILICILLTGCNSEKKYEKALSLLDQENWQEANIIFNDLSSDYEDVSILKNYAQAKLLVQENQDTEVLKNFYTDALEYLEDIPNDYNGKYKEEINEFSKLVTEEQITYEQKINEKKITELKGLVRNEMFTEALTKLNEISHNDVDTLRNFILARIEWDKTLEAPATDVTNWNNYLLYMSKIDSDYNGELSIEINQLVEKLHGSWNELSANIDRVNEINDYYIANPEPIIGMTSDEVRKSSWGDPKKINKTTSEYGISEQWIYYGDRYIYLEDSVVTTIKE